ncbi:hypothetical protein Leryth_010240 [Lithospermum erythrorhizon]|nr:hypothetical protein Leryth_010240 [Lithospermum erythrorhizon]
MGRIKSSEDIKTPEVFQVTTPQHDEKVASFPQVHETREFNGTGTPKHHEGVASFPPVSQPEEGTREYEGVAAFPPMPQPDQIEEIGNGQVNQQFGLAPQTPGMSLPLGNPWTTGLFDCSEDPTNATMTALFPCVTFGQLAEVIQSGNTTCATSSFLYLLTMPLLIFPAVMGANSRKMLRAKFGLVEAPYEDLFSHCFCLCCSLCQEFRELKNRGFDPALGWQGIMAQHMMLGNQQMSTPPPMQTMFK